MQETLRDVGSIPGSGRSPGGGHDDLLQHFCLENHTDRGAWWDRGVHGIAESDMTKQLTLSLSYPYLTTGKTIALTIQNFVSKVMPLLFNNTI